MRIYGRLGIVLATGLAVSGCSVKRMGAPARPSLRLPNLIAPKRARTLLARIEALF